jgi:hypothetical protein
VPVPHRPGPQGFNRDVAETFDLQMRLVHTPRRKPSVKAALRAAVLRLRELERRLDRAGAPR